MMPVISGVDGYSNSPVSVKTRSGSFTYGFKSPELPVGTVLSVIVTHVTDPEYFHCQGTKYAAAFGHLADKIHVHYSKLQPDDETLKLISPGQPCVAQYSVDKLWYRAKVNRELSGGAVEVFFVDYGNVEVVARNLIKVTKPDFMEMPAQGILCTLDGISNVHGYWSSEHIAKFEDLVLEQFFTATVKSVGSNGIHSVELSKEGENFQISLVFGRLTGTLCLEEDSDSSLRSVTVGRDRTNLQVTVESDSRNRTPPKGRSLTKNLKIRRDGIQDADLLRDDGASSSDSQSFASCNSDTSVCYKNFKFPVGSQLDVCMIFLISPHEFWCQPISMGSKLKSLMKELNENPTATRLEFDGVPSSKTPCLAKFSDDRMWYRAEVVEVKQGKAAVFYVDYGNAEILPLSELRMVPSRYAEVPTLAVKCCLNLDPKSIWSDLQIDRLQELALDERLTAKVISRTAGTYMLELYEPNTHTDLVSLIEHKGLLHQLPINNDMNLRVNVSWVTSPDDFWLHMANNERLLENMEQEMQDYYNVAADKYPDYPSVGAYVVVQFSEDNAWYRAIIEEVFDSKVKVCFVDFGNEEVVSSTNLRPLIPVFSQCPCQAVRCQLQDIKPLSVKGWTPEAKAYIENLTGDLICTFKKQIKNVFKVEIRQDGQSVAENMIKAGLAAAPLDVKAVHAHGGKRSTSSLIRGVANSFKVIEVLPNQVKSVMISHCNGLTDFWCQMAGFTDELNTLMDELAFEYDSSNVRSIGNRQFSLDSPCIAKYSEDDTWYRAIVVETMAASYSVQFVDYGNIEEVSPANMRQMSSKFMRLPKLAVPCKCYGIRSSSATRDDAFTELVLEKTMTARFMNAHPSDGVYEVELVLDDGTSVLKSLELSTSDTSDTTVRSILQIPVIPVESKLARGHSKIGSVCFAYSPDHFYIHFEEDDDKIDEVSEMLNAEYSQDKWANKYLPCIEQGMICCAKYSMDNQWYRACILAKNADTVSVCFVDYGNSENVSPQNLRPLLDIFCYMPALAYKFGLAGILPIETEWPQEVCDLFEPIVVGETWTVRHLRSNECLLINDENGFNVLGHLVKSGYATSKHVKVFPETSSVLSPSKVYHDVIFENQQDLSPGNRSLPDILFLSDIFPNVDVPSDEIQCSITHLTKSSQPGIFYLRLASQDEKYSELLLTLCNKLTNYRNPVVEVNRICCVYVAENNMCRGVITSVDKSLVGQVDIKVIDSGLYLQDVPVSDIRGISDEALSIPPLAYPCILENSLNWDKRLRSRFDLLTKGRYLTVKFKSTSRPYTVELLDESGDKISDAINGRLTKINKESNEDESVLKPFHVLQHETLGIYISHIVTPEDFWCQPEDSIVVLNQLKKEMRDCCIQGAGQDEIENSTDDFKAGTLCIVRFTKDDQFYRGKIQSLKRFSCDVLFVDYGYTETVEKKSIWPMQPKFLDLPAQAFECRLANIQSKDGSWSKNSLEVFQNLCLNQLLTAHVITSLQHPDGTGYVIDLILKQQNVADLLIEQNVAETFSKVELFDNVFVERSIIDALADMYSLSNPKVLRKGECLRIQVGHIESSQKFWVQLQSKVPLVEHLENLLTEVYENVASSSATIADLKTGMICAVINSPIGYSYRGCVQTVSDDNRTCSVLNIDTGTTETVECGCLKELYPCFMDISRHAFQCGLFTPDNEDVPLTKGWTGYLKVNAVADEGHYLVSLKQDPNFALLPVYSQPDYVTGFTAEVTVCFTTDPTNFWCQFTESAGLDYLMGRLKYLLKNDDNTTIPESELRVGLPCVAQYSEDGVFYRAEVLVLDMESASAQVSFCDYGNVEEIALSDLKPAPSELLILPKQAFHCCLNDSFPRIGEEWTEDMCSAFEQVVTDKVFNLTVISVSDESDKKCMVNMTDKNGNCLLKILRKGEIAKDENSLAESAFRETANSPNYGSAVEISTSDEDVLHTEESEEYKDISQASEEFGSEEFHDALHEDEPLKLKGNVSSSDGDENIDKIQPSSIKQSNTRDSGFVADFNVSPDNVKTPFDTGEDKNIDNSTSSSDSITNESKSDEMSTKVNLPNHVAAVFDSNHSEWEDMDRDLNTRFGTNYFSKDSKIATILSRLDGSQSFDLDSTFGDSDNETISPFSEWPLETGLRLKAFMLHCISPDHFYLRLCSMAEERVQLFSAIENSLSKLEPAEEKTFLPGSACLAKCNGDAEVWQRAIVRDEENDAIKVFFVDTGKEEKICKSSVRRCPLSLFSQSVLAISCFLADIQPLNGSWTSAALDLFKELTHNVPLELKAEVKSGGQHGIYLYKEGDDEAINDRFVDLGFAVTESGSKLEVNRELERSLLDPRRTEHMELSFHDISCCRESCYDDDFDCDTLDHTNSHEDFLFEDSIEECAVREKKEESLFAGERTVAPIGVELRQELNETDQDEARERNNSVEESEKGVTEETDMKGCIADDMREDEDAVKEKRKDDHEEKEKDDLEDNEKDVMEGEKKENVDEKLKENLKEVSMEEKINDDLEERSAEDLEEKMKDHLEENFKEEIKDDLEKGSPENNEEKVKESTVNLEKADGKDDLEKKSDSAEVDDDSEKVKEETDGDSEKVKEETDGDSEKVKEETDGDSEKMEEETDGDSEKVKEETDGDSEKVKEETDGDSEKVKEETDDDSEKVKEETDDDSEKVKEETDDDSEKVEEETDDDSEKVEEETDDDSEKVEEETDDDSEKVEEETDEDSEKVEEETDEDSEKVEEETDEDSEKVEEETDEDSEKVKEEADDDSEKVEEEADDDSEKVEEEADDDSEKVEEETDDDSEKVEEEADDDSEKVKEEADDDSEKVKEEADDDSEKVKEEADDDSEKVKEEADDDSEKVKEEADDDSEKVKEEADDDSEKVKEEADDDSEKVKEEADDDSEKVKEEADDDSEKVKEEADDDSEKAEEKDDLEKKNDSEKAEADDD